MGHGPKTSAIQSWRVCLHEQHHDKFSVDTEARAIHSRGNCRHDHHDKFHEGAKTPASQSSRGKETQASFPAQRSYVGSSTHVTHAGCGAARDASAMLLQWHREAGYGPRCASASSDQEIGSVVLRKVVEMWCPNM